MSSIVMVREGWDNEGLKGKDWQEGQAKHIFKSKIVCSRSGKLWR